METGLATIQEPRSLTERLTPAQIKADYNLVLQAMGSCMEKDKDYGVIPGTFKPTLYKPGAEKLMLMFRLASRPVIEDLSGPDEIRYRVSTEIIYTPSGTIVGYGVGEASTNEEKYKWRKAIKEEWDETPEDRRRRKWQSGRDGAKPFQVLQVRTNPADLANTALKMADKRSIISGTLKVTAASSVFSQDLEDMSEDIRDAVAQAETPAPPTMPQAKAPAAAAPAAAPAAAAPAPSAKREFRLMSAKYPGECKSVKCVEASKHIAEGERIAWDDANRVAYHPGCAGL